MSKIDRPSPARRADNSSRFEARTQTSTCGAPRPRSNRTESRSSGRIAIEGVDLKAGRSRALAATNFAAVYAPLPGNLTVEQNLRVFGMIYGVSGLTARIEELLKEFELTHLRRTKCGVLSSGGNTFRYVAAAGLHCLVTWTST